MREITLDPSLALCCGSEATYYFTRLYYVIDPTMPSVVLCLEVISLKMLAGLKSTAVRAAHKMCGVHY